MRTLLLNILILSIVFFSSNAVAQDWEPIGVFNGFAKHMTKDTISDLLYVAGGFNEVDGVPNQGLVKYDGNEVTTINGASLNTFADQYFFYNDIIVFQGDLYVASPDVVVFGSMEGEAVSSNIMRFDGEQWESLFPDFGYCNRFTIINDKLYLLGVLNDPSDHIMAVYDGVDIEYITFQSNTLNIDDWEGVLNCGVEFEGQLLFAGDINNTGWELSGPNPEDILVFDPEDQTFGIFPDAPDIQFSSSGQSIYDLEVWNDELIGFGNLNPGLNIWTLGIGILNDGFWEPIGGMEPVNDYILNGMSPVEQALLVDEYCLVVGGYDSYLTPDDDYFPVSHVGFIDGQEFYPLSSDFFIEPSELNDVIVYHDTIFVAGSFQHINTYAATSVVKFNGSFPPVTTSNFSVSGFNEMVIYPNPVTGGSVQINTTQNKRGVTLAIFNITGQVIFETILQSDQNTIDISSLSPGIYVLQVMNGNETLGTEKLVVQ